MEVFCFLALSLLLDHT